MYQVEYGLTTWNRLGRYVKKGEKGIMIFAPMFGKQKRQEPSDGEQDHVEEGNAAAGTDGSRLVGFKAVYVYDITQTDGAELTCDALQGSTDFTAIGRPGRPLALRMDTRHKPRPGEDSGDIGELQGIL